MVGKRLTDTHPKTDVTSTGNSYCITEIIIQAWEYMCNFILNFHAEELLKHLKLEVLIDIKVLQMRFKAYKTFYCTGTSLVLQTNLNIATIISTMLRYYMFIELLYPAG